MTTATVKAPVKVVAANGQRVTERMRSLLTLLNLHFAGVAVLALVVLYLVVQIVTAWTAAHSSDTAALAQQTVSMKTAEIAAKPLQGLDAKLTTATGQADEFYGKRLPFAHSQVVGELGALTKKTGVKLSRVGYADSPVLSGTKGELTQMQMDASLNGDYRPLVLFINALERDKMFFLISGVTLTGQQSGTVGLRVRLTTFLREPVGKEVSEKAVVGPGGNAVVEDPAAGGGKPR